MAKRYGRGSWIGLGVVLLLGAAAWAYDGHQERQLQHRAYETAQQSAKQAEALESPEESLDSWQEAIALLREVESGHPKYELAQKAISDYSQKANAVREEIKAVEAAESTQARAAAQEKVASYNAFLKVFDPEGLAVSSVSLDPNIDSQIVVTVGSSWGAANRTQQLDLADSLWKGWGNVCDCSVPRIKFQSPAGRNLGGTGIFGAAIELKD